MVDSEKKLTYLGYTLHYSQYSGEGIACPVLCLPGTEVHSALSNHLNVKWSPVECWVFGGSSVGICVRDFSANSLTESRGSYS